MAQAFGTASEVASRWFTPPRNASHDLEHNLCHASRPVDRDRPDRLPSQTWRVERPPRHSTSSHAAPRERNGTTARVAPKRTPAVPERVAITTWVIATDVPVWGTPNTRTDIHRRCPSDPSRSAVLCTLDPR